MYNISDLNVYIDLSITRLIKSKYKSNVFLVHVKEVMTWASCKFAEVNVYWHWTLPHNNDMIHVQIPPATHTHTHTHTHTQTCVSNTHNTIKHIPRHSMDSWLWSIGGASGFFNSHLTPQSHWSRTLHQPTYIINSSIKSMAKRACVQG